MGAARWWERGGAKEGTESSKIEGGAGLLGGN